jgi:hypothetical protein
MIVLIGAATSIGAAGWAVLASDGWGVLIWLPCVLVAGLFHLVLQVRLVSTSHVSADLAKLALLSSATFLAAFLLQVDEGDGPRWIIATAILSGSGGGSRLPAWWPSWVNWLAFVPMVVSWALLVRRTGPR